MSEKYKVIDSSTPTFITVTVTGWVDLFVRPVYAQILDASLNYCIEEKGLRIHAYVYMPSHLHAVVTSVKEELQNIIRDFKKFTSKALVSAIKEHPESRREWLLNKFRYEAKRTNRASNYKLWQDGFHPVLLDTVEKVEQRINYIHYNPVETGFVYQERDWVNSSYAQYEEGNLETSNVNLVTLW